MQKSTGITLLFVCIMMVLASGCTSQEPTNAATTPAPQIVYVTVLVTPSPLNTQAQDPIVGVWRYSDSSTGYDDRYQFNTDGTFIENFYDNFQKATHTYRGIWVAEDDNSYSLHNTSFRDSEAFIYNPVKKTLNPASFPAMLLTPYQGSVEITSSPYAATPTIFPQSSPSSTHLSGTGDDVQSFTATGDGLRIFTMSYSGEHNFAVWLKDSQGKEIDLLANEIGSYNGKKSARLGSGKYYLDMTASGPWSVTITSA